MAQVETKIAVGVAEVRRLLAGLLKAANDVDFILGYSNLDRLHANFPEYEYDSTNPARQGSGRPSKLLYSSSQGPIYKAGDQLHNRQSRFVPESLNAFSGDFSIIGDNVLFLIFELNRAPVGINIRSAQLAQDFTALFNSLWDAAKPTDQTEET